MWNRLLRLDFDPDLINLSPDPKSFSLPQRWYREEKKSRPTHRLLGLKYNGFGSRISLQAPACRLQ